MAGNNNIPQFVNSDSFMADKNYVKWLSDLKKRFRMSQLKAAVKVNTEMLKFYWSLGEGICEKQKQYKWGANFMKRLSLDLRAEFPQAEGFSWSNLYKIRKWYLFYSSQIEFLYHAGTKLQKVDNATIPMPELLLSVPWRHQTVIVSKCTTQKEQPVVGAEQGALPQDGTPRANDRCRTCRVARHDRKRFRHRQGYSQCFASRPCRMGNILNVPCFIPACQDRYYPD